jgi:hypothetical protein
VLVHRTQVGLGDSVPLPRRQLVPLEGGVEIAPGTLAVFIQPAEVILRLGITLEFDTAVKVGGERRCAEQQAEQNRKN